MDYRKNQQIKMLSGKKNTLPFSSSHEGGELGGA